MTTMTIIWALLIGALGGLVAALCGVGGGVIMVPAFVLLLGMDQKHAVATSLAVIAPTAAMAITKFSGNKLVNWQIFVPTAIGAVIVAYFAADYMKTLSNATLTRIFAVVMIVVGLVKLFEKPGA